MEKDEKKVSDGLKALFVIVGAIVTIGAIAMVLYNVFKKYFKITVECEDGDEEDCFDDFDEYDPVCSPEDCASCEKKEDEDEEEEEDEDEEEDEE